MSDLTDTERDMLAAVGRYDRGYITRYGTPEHAMALALEAKRFLKVEAVSPTSYTWKFWPAEGLAAGAMAGSPHEAAANEDQPT